MSPQPLGRIKPDATLHIGPLAPAADFDAELCKLATYVISLWSYTEAGLLRMASQFLRTEQSVVTDMLQAVKSAEGRWAAVKAAGLHRLAASPDDSLFFLAALDALAHAQRLRHQYAHSIWASSPDIPGAIILIDPRLIERAVAAEYEGITEVGWQFTSATHFDRMKVMVYRQPDLMEDVREAGDAALIMDGLEEWYGFLSVDARDLASNIHDHLLEEYPRLRNAFNKRLVQGQSGHDAGAV
jgi:hypothetical protein